jgi:hypothetical protein
MSLRSLLPSIAKRARVWWADRSLRQVVFVFLLTRTLIFVIFVLTTHLVIYETRPNETGVVREAGLSLSKVQIARRLRPLAAQGDGGWYMGIAQYGYEHQPFDIAKQHTWAFFPTFPLLLGLVASFTGEYNLTGIVLSTLLFFPALFFVYKTIRAFGYDDDIANRAIFYLAAYPTSYFFSLPMTESLFLLVLAASLYAGTRDRWWLAGLLAAIASATRGPGILLLPALAILYWERHGFKLRRPVAGLLLAPLGLIAFMIFLRHITGNGFAAFQATRVWGREFSFFLSPLYMQLMQPSVIAVPWKLLGLDFLASILALIGGTMLLIWRKWSLGFLLLAGVILPLSSRNLQSHARYVMVLFPVYLPLAIAGRRPRVDQTIRAIFISLLALLCALFAARFTFTYA